MSMILLLVLFFLPVLWTVVFQTYWLLSYRTTGKIDQYWGTKSRCYYFFTSWPILHSTVSTLTVAWLSIITTGKRNQYLEGKKPLAAFSDYDRKLSWPEIRTTDSLKPTVCYRPGYTT